MLSEALTRYVDLRQSLGFKFRIQRQLLANFVRFAEGYGDEFIRVARVLEWAVEAPSPPESAGIACSPRAASPCRCGPRIHVTKYRQPMRSVGGCSGGKPRTSTRPRRSRR